MKTKLILISLSLIILSSCGNSSKEVVNKEEITQKKEGESVTKEINSLTKYQSEIKETLFFYFRNQVDGLGEYRFVKYENIEFTGDKVIYTIVTLPKSEVEEFNATKEVMTSSFISSFASNEPASDRRDDSIRVEGLIFIKDLIGQNLEKGVSSVKIEFNGKWKNSSMSWSPYEGEERKTTYDPFDTELIVEVAEPRIYTKDQMYLKARITELTKNDLTAYDKDELAYLRNEIFARHGHTFKTAKMQDYFTSKDWYVPYTDDATDWLNETEKKNAQFLKQLESEV